MITQKNIRKASELSGLSLSGIEVVTALAGNNGTDFHSVSLKDSKTGTILTIGRGPYSDLQVHATLPVKTEIRFVLVDKTDDGEFRSKPVKDEEIGRLKNAHPGGRVEEVEIEVEDQP